MKNTINFITLITFQLPTNYWITNNDWTDGNSVKNKNE